MKKDQISRVLNGMLSKKYQYKGETHTILRFSNENVVKITTDKKDLTFLPDDFQPTDFLEIAEAVMDEPITSIIKNEYNQQPTQVTLVNSNSLITRQGVDIANIIRDNIEKVRSNPAYVPQAEAINNSVKTFIELAKVEVEMIKVTRG